MIWIRFNQFFFSCNHFLILIESFSEANAETAINQMSAQCMSRSEPKGIPSILYGIRMAFDFPFFLRETKIFRLNKYLFKAKQNVCINRSKL